MRALDDASLREVARLRHEWRTLERGEGGLQRDAFDDEILRWARTHRDTHLAFLACEGDVAVGCAWLALVERIPAPASLARRAGMIQSVYVSPPMRGRGLGTELMGEVVAEARRLGLDYLMVHPSERAFPFYRRLGFDDADRLLELRF